MKKHGGKKGFRGPLTLWACIAITGAHLFAAAPASAGDPLLPSGGFLPSPFGDLLTERLVAEGFDRQQVLSALGDSRGAVNRTTLAYAIVYRESKADYSHFLDPDRLARARQFLQRKETVLRKAEERFHVPAEVTAAILMIESDFGNFRKLHPTVNVLSTLVWAGQPENFETVSSVIRKRLPDVADEKIRARTKKKAEWGFGQLKTLLQIAGREKIDPFEIEGSWAGAFGLPQFIPTSYWEYAVDGDGDGRVDLFNEDDAIFSIGNYLKTFGWKKDLTTERKKAVLRRYNNSGLYVDSVLEAASRLDRGDGERG